VTRPTDPPLPPALRAHRSIGHVDPAVGRGESGQRRRILLAATGLFGQRGYRGVTTDDLAATANVSVGSIYTFFDDKRECLLAAYDRLVADAGERIVRSIPPRCSWAEQLDAALVALLADIDAEPAAARLALVVVRTAGPDGAARHRQTLAELTALVRRGREADLGTELAPGFEDVAVASAAALLAEALCGDQMPEPAALLRDLRALLLGPGGVAGPRPAAGPSSTAMTSAACP
jgi:AcrR family transcriptional regulator